ncbi:MAG: alpha/beta fold hydrolase [Bacteroidota bacterium]
MAVELNYQRLGEGPPLVILHGLFGSLDNWRTLGKRFAERCEVYLVDQRNHGRSPHAEPHSYAAMAEDLLQFLDDRELEQAHIIGHSMGGKTLLQFITQHADRVQTAIVADMAARAYEGGHDDIIAALQSVDFEAADERKDVDRQLKDAGISVPGIRMFLMKGLIREKDSFRWRFNLDLIDEQYSELQKPVELDGPYDCKLLMLRGENSAYISDADAFDMQQHFSDANLVTLEGAGHWLHADAPDAFAEAVERAI